MKNIKKLFVLLFVIAIAFSCDDSSTLIDDSEDVLTGNAIVGGLVKVGNPLITYVVGSGNDYTASGTIQQGRVATTSVDVYKSFTDNFTGAKSNRELLTTISVTSTNAGDIASYSYSFSYSDLISGLSLDGSPLPTDDSDLNIGDFWTLEYVSTTSEGNVVKNANTTKVAVGTRYAGVYTVVDSEYWNSGSFLGNWNGTEVVIESVDASIYRHVGHAYWDDQEYFFTVDNTTGYITVLQEDLEGNGALINTSPIMTCEGSYTYEMIPCDATTSVATPDDVNGKDQLEFTVGYFRGVGATREFYEKLVKN